MLKKRQRSFPETLLMIRILDFFCISVNSYVTATLQPTKNPNQLPDGNCLKLNFKNKQK